MSFTDRFWSKVKRADGCWLWRAAKNKHGYGLFSVSGRSTLAHRVAYELMNGPIPTGRSVMHKCDTPSCVNPDHMRVGTQSDNVQDMVEKGRVSRGQRHSEVLRRTALKGDKHWRARLTADAVRAIRAAASNGVSGSELARRYGVDPSTVSLVISGRTWSCLSQ